jgi:hypothetical protein
VSARADWYSDSKLQSLKVWLEELARAGALASTVVLASCSGGEPAQQPRSPTPTPTPAPPVFRLLSLPGFDELDCDAIARAELSRSVPIDAITLWQGGAIYVTRGEACASAAERDACLAALAAFPPGSVEGSLEPFMAITNRQGARTFMRMRDAPPQGLRELLGAIDTVERAFVWAFMNGRGAWCGPGSRTRMHDGAVELVVTRQADCGEQGAHTLVRIAPDGSFRVLDTEIFVNNDSACDGRRPDGLTGAPLALDAASCLARMAYHEAASIAAFDQLAGQLGAWGAPRTLVDACRRAAHDEARHARLVDRLARDRGAIVPSLPYRRAAPRTLVDLAIENAREGCVRETYGAHAGAYMAEHASDPAVQSAMSSIAPDEAEHAALSQRLAAWMDERMSVAERMRVRAEMHDAALRLEHEIDATAPSYARELGLPPRAVASAIVAQIFPFPRAGGEESCG